MRQSTASMRLLMLLPALLFLGLPALAVFVFIKISKFAVNGIGSEQFVHIQNRFLSVDIRSQTKQDNLLSSMLIYPGASLEEGPPEREIELNFRGKTVRTLCSTYRTAEEFSIVWEFYRRELPGWTENQGAEVGRELIHQDGNVARSIHVSRQGDRTVIVNSVNIKAAALVNAAGSGR